MKLAYKCPNCNDDKNYKQDGNVFVCLTCDKLYHQRVQFTIEYLQAFWDGYNKGFAVAAASYGG